MTIATATASEIVASLMLIIGAIFLLVGSVGLTRLPDFFMRLHAPTKATTLGVGMVLLACMVRFSEQQDYLSVHELMITVFLFITAPITAHMLAKVALHYKLSLKPGTRNEALAEAARKRQTPDS